MPAALGLRVGGGQLFHDRRRIHLFGVITPDGAVAVEGIPPRSASPIRIASFSRSRI